ncbi:MAG: GT4 family glycosyltransferase PelF [Vicinamibacterales bacterium]|nr:GT4 family glycosyltransferase PelF [Vicinamibacterales bacterium]
MTPRPADVCLVLEGTYPYVAGGVSAWAHDLIKAQPRLTFSLLSILPPQAPLERKYELPPNVVALEHLFLNQLPAGPPALAGGRELLARLQAPLDRIHRRGGLDEVREVMRELRAASRTPGRAFLLDSREAWDMLLRMYRAGHDHLSFLDYFWTWRTQLLAMYSVLLAPVPPARVYHTLCTGYAGLFAARAHLETGRPALLTEHGIYTNERRIEITMADWLREEVPNGLSIDRHKRDLKSLWIDTFRSFSRACYEACDPIVTLYEGNTVLQLEDGADRSRLQVIPNGIDLARYGSLEPSTAPRRPTVALIGRVVPIKDVKTFLRAVARLRDAVPDARALVLGPLEEDPGYVDQCRILVDHLGLHDTVTFTGRVSLNDYLPQIDVVVLTSLSEAQPLVILEAGAAGIPCVATDVGACREMILGRSDESPSLGAGGVVTPVASPAATADAMARLLEDVGFRGRSSLAIQARVRRHYDKADLDARYRALYEQLVAVPDAPAAPEEVAWPA